MRHSQCSSPFHSDYLKFRSFIFGTAPKEGNPMFPNGVIYEGVGDEKPTYFRGESGANDS
jgi:indoleamine 2,3-dioxygenase